MNKIRPLTEKELDKVMKVIALAKEYNKLNRTIEQLKEISYSMSNHLLEQVADIKDLGIRRKVKDCPEEYAHIQSFSIMEFTHDTKKQVADHLQVVENEKD